MVQDLLAALLRAQAGDLKRRGTGVALHLAALAMAGLAVAFLSLALFLWLAERMPPPVAALAVAGLALLAAAGLVLAGRARLRRSDAERRADTLTALEALEVLLRPAKEGEGAADRAPALVGAALAAGVLLGRSLGR